ncbi:MULTISPECIES: carbohydrate-binding protein [unclassified Fibrobacter]|uniref:carbohydrate-binding protein n=1 Tax=unclassified Fibrobacter TaxID=2634177 RepID=UPI001E3AB8E6|nr:MULTISPECIES: carbohydrate-binding protein [unclassified Fibrobacter]
MGILEWEFQGAKREPEPQTAHNASKTPWPVPGVVQAEDFDDPGYGAGNDSYYEDDTDNHSCTDAGKEAECSKYRDGTGVDIYKKSEKKTVVGYIRKGEWLEYSVNAAAAGDYTMFIAAASNGGASLTVSVNGDEAGEVTVPAATSSSEEENYDDYNKVSTNVTLKEGVNIIRITAAADWFDLDYFNLVKGKDSEDDNPLGEQVVVPADTSDKDPLAIGLRTDLRLNLGASAEYHVFDLQGHKLGSVRFEGTGAVLALKSAGFAKGVYMLKQVNGSRQMMVSTSK